jgi:hypothetical protein
MTVLTPLSGVARAKLTNISSAAPLTAEAVAVAGESSLFADALT